MFSSFIDLDRKKIVRILIVSIIGFSSILTFINMFLIKVLNEDYVNRVEQVKSDYALSLKADQVANLEKGLKTIRMVSDNGVQEKMLSMEEYQFVTAYHTVVRDMLDVFSNNGSICYESSSVCESIDKSYLSDHFQMKRAVQDFKESEYENKMADLDLMSIHNVVYSYEKDGNLYLDYYIVSKSENAKRLYPGVAGQDIVFEIKDWKNKLDGYIKGNQSYLKIDDWNVFNSSIKPVADYINV